MWVYSFYKRSRFCQKKLWKNFGAGRSRVLVAAFAKAAGLRQRRGAGQRLERSACRRRLQRNFVGKPSATRRSDSSTLEPFVQPFCPAPLRHRAYVGACAAGGNRPHLAHGKSHDQDQADQPVRPGRAASQACPPRNPARWRPKRWWTPAPPAYISNPASSALSAWKRWTGLLHRPAMGRRNDRSMSRFGWRSRVVTGTSTWWKSARMCPTCVGQIPLEYLDFVVDSKHCKLIPNPEHGGQQMCEEY